MIMPNVRTRAAKDVQPVVRRHLGMDPVIRAETPASAEETRRSLEEHLTEANLQVVYETDIEDSIDGGAACTNLVRVLKVGRSRPFSQYQPPRSQIPLGRKAVKTGAFMALPSASVGETVDPAAANFLPPTVALSEDEGVTQVRALRPTTALAVFGERGPDQVAVELESALWDALEAGIPDCEFPEQAPPVRTVDGERASKKSQFHALLSLEESEYAVKVSTDRPLREMRSRGPEALSRPGQHVLGPVANGQLLFVLHPESLCEALAVEPDLAAFTPLPVSIYEEEGRTHMRSIRPTALLAFFDEPTTRDPLTEMEVLLWHGIVEAVPDGRLESRRPRRTESGHRPTDALADGPNAERDDD